MSEGTQPLKRSRPTRDELVERINAAHSLQEVAAHYGVSRMTLHRWRDDLGITVRKAPKAA